jgi:superfamily II DNA or RNA helicase
LNKPRSRALSRRFEPIPKVIRKSSPYFEVAEADKETLTRLKQIAEPLTPAESEGPNRFKLLFDKAAKRPLSELNQLFAEVDYHVSPSLQKAILKRQGVTRFAELRLRKSDLILKPTGFLELEAIKPVLTYNAKEKLFHARIMDYYTIQNYLETKGYPVVTHFTLQFTLPESVQSTLQLDMVLREYQEDALRRWQGAKGKGVVVLPTGGGKTILGLEAIRRLVETTLIVVPTLDLLSQWREALEVLLHVPVVGILGGGKKDIEKDGFLAPYEIHQIQVSLKPEEKARYESHMKIFRQYTRRLDEIDPGWQFDTIVKRTVFDPDAREALSNLEKARRVALEASGKINQVEALLQQYRDMKVLIFSRYTRVVERISDLFGIPLITHKTKVSEREKILTAFKAGEFTKIVTGQVLDEGVDVPDASIGIIISGTGSKREFIQRLGRLLRPQKDKAILYELVTESTLEDGLSRRRQLDEEMD